MSKFLTNDKYRETQGVVKIMHQTKRYKTFFLKEKRYKTSQHNKI